MECLMKASSAIVETIIRVQKINVVTPCVPSKPGLPVLLGFVAHSARSCQQAHFAEKRSMNVTFQNGAMDIPLSVLMMFICSTGAPVKMVATAMKRIVISEMDSANKSLAKKPGVQLTDATENSTPKVTVLATVVCPEVHT